MALLISLVVWLPVGASAQEDGPSRPLADEARAGEHRIVRGRVQTVHGPRLFTVETRGGSSRTMLVLGPDARSTPAAGATVEAHGMVRHLEESDFDNTPGWEDIDDATRARLTGRQVLVAISLLSASSVPPALRPADAPPGQPERTGQQRRGAVRADVAQTTVRPSTLADQIGDLAGRQVRVPYARVVGVLDPRAFLIDTSTSLPPAIGNRDRVLVLVGNGALRVSPESLVASAVVVEGVARTLLGMQVTGEVPWPARLDRATIERLEVRAAILATSVHTADGVELTSRPSTSTAEPARSPRRDRGGAGGRSRAAVR
jgi:hypothetical protein